MVNIAQAVSILLVMSEPPTLLIARTLAFTPYVLRGRTQRKLQGTGIVAEIVPLLVSGPIRIVQRFLSA